MANPNYALPPLPYGYDALEPTISSKIMTLHHDKHHQTYVTNLNGALTQHATALSAKDTSSLKALQGKIKFNGGGHINHSLFWDNLAPAGSPGTEIGASAAGLKAAIEGQFGSVEDFIKAFNATLLGIQGSGWGWLVKNKGSGKLEIVTTKDQDPVGADAVPIFGIDMWEHAYYLDYLNNKAGYVTEIWKVINWATAEERFKNGVEREDFRVLLDIMVVDYAKI